MPYNNIPKSKWTKMESCTAKVGSKSPGVNKYAVCYSSIMGKLKENKKKYGKKIVRIRKKSY